jgi:hypothetical protein
MGKEVTMNWVDIITIAVVSALVLAIIWRYVVRRKPYGYPENAEGATTWEQAGLTFVVNETTLGPDHRHYCGYVRFPKRPLKEKGYKGIVRFVPVHGGVTFAEKDRDGSMVYGFDCAHNGDDERPECKDLEWLKAETERLGVSLAIASRYEKELARVKTKEAKLGIIMAYHLELHNLGIEFDAQENLLAMLAFATGDL